MDINKIQNYQLIKTNEYHLDICTQEMKVIIRLWIQTSKKKTEVYERTLNSINNIEGLEEAFEGLQEFVEHIRNPDHVEVNLANKSILIVERSKLKNKKKMQIASLSLNLARTIEKDEEQDLIDKILLRCEDKRDLTGNEIKDFLQKIAFCISELNKDRHKNEEKNQIFKGHIEEKLENNFRNYFHIIQDHESIKKQLNNLDTNYEYIDKLTKNLTFKNEEIQKILSLQIKDQNYKTTQNFKMIQQIKGQIQELKKSLKMIQNSNAKRILPQISKVLNQEQNLNTYIQNFESERKIRIQMRQQIIEIPELITELVGLQTIQLICIKQQDEGEHNQGQVPQLFYKKIPNSITKLKTLKQLSFENINIDFTKEEFEKIAHIKSLKIQKSSMTQFPHIKIFSELQSLVLTNCIISDFPMNILELSKLKHLDLSSNLLKEIPKQITKLEHLENVYFQNNPLPYEAILQLIQNLKQLKKMKELNLSQLKMEQVPKGIFELYSLQSLCLSNNQFIRLPSQIGNLKNLTQLILDECNNMLSLPSEIGNLSKLSYLSLSSEVMGVLPTQIENLEELQQLWIMQKGNLLELPKQLNKLKKLKQIVINNQQLTVLPDQICNLTNLTNFDFQNNELTKLPQNIGNLINLTSLSLSGNKITTVPQSIRNLGKATFIDLNGNSLNEKTINFLKQMKKQGFSSLYFD